MTDSAHQLFIVKSNDGIVVRLSLVGRLLENSKPFEVVIYGLPQESIKEPHVAVGKLLDWSPYTRDCYEVIPESDEGRQQHEIVRQRAAITPDVKDDDNHVLFALAIPDGYCVRTQSELLASAPELESCETLSLQTIDFWAFAALREGVLSKEEFKELDRRTDAACERYGWPDLGKEYDAQGEHEQTRNIAYLMLRRKMSFRAAVYEYLSALERGSRQLAAAAELDSAATDLLNTINSNMNRARLGLVAGVPLANEDEAACTSESRSAQSGDSPTV